MQVFGLLSCKQRRDTHLVSGKNKKNNLVKENIKDEYEKQVLREKSKSRVTIRLHGKFQRDTKVIKSKDVWGWFVNGDLKCKSKPDWYPPKTKP